jgi:dTDP-4-dehydrorhamnose 3,5-epimerase
MLFHETNLSGVHRITLERRGDDRGFFARTFCERVFSEAGLETRFVQQNMSFSAQRGTLRGLHFQRGEHAEAKLIRCTRGAILDLVVDLRSDSPTYLGWTTIELTAENREMAYVPLGCAHGYMTLTDEAEASYMTSAYYAGHAEGGLRWDDPGIGLVLPFHPTVVSDKDRAWPDWKT